MQNVSPGASFLLLNHSALPKLPMCRLDVAAQWMAT